MNRYHAIAAEIALLLAILLPGSIVTPTAAEEVTAIALQAEQGDLTGAVAAYRAQYDPATARGLVALRQLAIQVLRLGLRLSEPQERNVVAGVLGRWGDPAALWILDEAVHSTEPMLRRTAVDTLGDLATPGAVCVLRRLYYTDVEGRRLALSGLRRTGDKTALLCYLDALTSPDSSLRAQGISGLGELRTPAALPSLRKLLKTEKDPLVSLTIARALAVAGDQAGLTYLKTKLTGGQEQIRDSAAGLLGTLDNPSVAPLLRTALTTDPSAMVRTTAAASLSHFKDPSGLPLVQEALEDIDFRIRLAAAVSMSRMDYATAKPLVLRALGSADPLVRTNAFKVVGENTDRSVAPLVVEAIGRETDRYAESQALWTLGQIGGVETIPLLVDLLDEEREEVRHSSAEALVMISDRLLQGKH